LHAIQREIHDSFIALVKARRGDKLDSRETALFSGEYWTGERARQLGLVDAIGDLRGVLRERYGEKVRMPLIAERGMFGRRLPGVGRGGPALERPSLAEDLVATIEARALWARYGL
jgi:ClpP class serine protease